MATATNSTADWTTAKSRWKMASISTLPRPRRPNTVSAMIEPLIMPTNRSPATVIVGSSELRRAWPKMIVCRLKPLARAVLT